MTNIKSAGQILKIARIKSGLTQFEVAKKSGIHPNTYAKIERGVQAPSFATIKRLAKVLNVKIEDIPATK
jgi:transcriptional regulator with XRE-family HTH domain